MKRKQRARGNSLKEKQIASNHMKKMASSLNYEAIPSRNSDFLFHHVISRNLWASCSEIRVCQEYSGPKKMPVPCISVSSIKQKTYLQYCKANFTESQTHEVGAAWHTANDLSPCLPTKISTDSFLPTIQIPLFHSI